jgi:hypothetical protein
MLRRLRIPTLVALVTIGLALAGPAAHHTRFASADAGGALAFAPATGAASLSRTVSFAGFADNEVIDITFYDPSGAQAAVGGDTTFYASAEADGTGAFSFRPSDWLADPQSGSWTVQAVGETSGVTATASFAIQ